MRYTDTENNSNKTFQTFVSEMFSTIGEATKWFPINAANPFAADSEMARRRKEEADARDAHYRTSFHDLPKKMKAKMIKAGSPELSDKEADAKASVMPGSRRKRGISEDLRNWFSPSHPDGGWKRINSDGEAIGPCAREPGEPKPKCMSNKKRGQLSKKGRAAAVRSKRMNDPDAERQGKPINVSNFGGGKIDEEYIIDPKDHLIESMDLLLEKNKPTSPDKWADCISQAKAKFDVYPSAYANGWASKCYKGKGGKWKAVSEQKLSFSAFVSEMFSTIGEEETKPYKGFVKGKNHPEGGLSREEAKRHGIHAGIETKDEAKRKGGFGKLSDKTQSRRKSFCARMQGMKKHNTSAKTANDPKSKINASLRVWGCRSEANET